MDDLDPAQCAVEAQEAQMTIRKKPISYPRVDGVWRPKEYKALAFLFLFSDYHHSQIADILTAMFEKDFTRSKDGRSSVVKTTLENAAASSDADGASILERFCARSRRREDGKSDYTYENVDKFWELMMEDWDLYQEMVSEGGFDERKHGRFRSWLSRRPGKPVLNLNRLEMYEDGMIDWGYIPDDL